MKKNFWIFLLPLAVIPFLTQAFTNELTEAVTWLNQNGLTKHSTTTTFKASNTIRRDESSKFFSVFAKNILKRTNVATSSSCRNLTDVSETNTMKTHILDACNRGYVLGNNGRFNPKSSLTNEQAVSIIIRMLEGKKDESGSRRSDQYYARAIELGLLDDINLGNKNISISRGILGILLYRVGQLPGVEGYTTDTIKTNRFSLDPSIKLVVSSEDKTDNAFISVNIGDTVTIHGLPKNLQGLSYHVGIGKPPQGYFNRASFFDQKFSNNNSCNISEAPVDGEWSITCNAKVPGSSFFYIVIYANGKEYKSNTVGVRIKSSITSSSNTTLTKPDLMITSLSLDPNYPSPKLDDPHVYLKLTIKNIGKSINFSPSIKGIISCTSNNSIEIINKEIIQGTIGTNQTLTLSFSNVYNSNIYLFLTPQKNYHIRCNVSLPSTILQESVVDENNIKSVYFDVGAPADSPNLPDLYIESITIQNLQSQYKTNTIQRNPTNDRIAFTVKNRGTSAYDPTLFASDNFIMFECYSDVGGEGGSTARFEAPKLYPGDGQQVMFPTNLFTTFTTQTMQSKNIACHINYVRGMKDKYGNDIESDYTNNSKSFSFEVRAN